MDRGNVDDLGSYESEVASTDNSGLADGQGQRNQLVFRFVSISILETGGSTMNGAAVTRISPLAHLVTSYAVGCGLKVMSIDIAHECIIFTLSPAPRGGLLSPAEAHAALIEISKAIRSDVRSASLMDCVPSLCAYPEAGLIVADKGAEDDAASYVVARAVSILRWCVQFGVQFEDAIGRALPLPPANSFPGLPENVSRFRTTFCATRQLPNGDLMDESQRRILLATHPLSHYLIVGDEVIGDFADGGTRVFRALDYAPLSAHQIRRNGTLILDFCVLPLRDGQLSFDY